MLLEDSDNFSVQEKEEEEKKKEKIR